MKKITIGIVLFALSNTAIADFNTDVINGASLNQLMCKYYNICKIGDVGYTDYTKATAIFTASTTSGAAPLSVTFTNKSYPGSNNYVQNTLSYSWDFGDGSFSSSKDQAHTYTKPGNYTVTLIATDPRGSSSKPYSLNIAVTSPAQAQVAIQPISSQVDGIYDGIYSAPNYGYFFVTEKQGYMIIIGNKTFGNNFWWLASGGNRVGSSAKLDITTGYAKGTINATFNGAAQTVSISHTPCIPITNISACAGASGFVYVGTKVW